MRARTAPDAATASSALLGLALGLGLAVAPGPAQAQKTQPYDGFLCCSMLVSGTWIDDQNYEDGYKKIVPAGTPVKFTGFGRWRLQVLVEGKKLEIGNWYSRTISMDDFALRYVPTQDPNVKLQAWGPKVREAILARKIRSGMTREQVIMALGYPTTDKTPDMAAVVWHYSFRAGDFQIFWTDDGKVDRLFGVPEARAKVFIE